MKIAKQFSCFDVWFLRGHLQFLYVRHSGIENLFWKRIFRLDCGVGDKTHREQSLAKPSTINILILIPMRTSLIHILSDDSSALRPCPQAMIIYTSYPFFV